MRRSTAGMPVVAHSKGGGMMIQLAEALPMRMSRLVVIDGLPSMDPHPDVSDHEQRRFSRENLAAWLDHRRSAGSTFRKPGTVEELAKRRKRMNPRLPDEWLQYLVTIGARRDADGWRWKLDPAIRFGGFGPWRPAWSVETLKTLRVPLLGLTATVEEEMGWGTNHKSLIPNLPLGAQLVPFENTGHFIHIEHPERVAKMILEFLG